MEDHILMSGDAAGMITPLCGNGMAMAIHGAKILSEHVLRFCHAQCTRQALEVDYENAWKGMFSRRLWTGRQIQKLFGGEASSAFAVLLAQRAKPIAGYLVNKTHGNPF